MRTHLIFGIVIPSELRPEVRVPILAHGDTLAAHFKTSRELFGNENIEAVLRPVGTVFNKMQNDVTVVLRL